jgi:HD-GYP domain-containing protein (c-di-GMP phosphodiesterase class II)
MMLLAASVGFLAWFVIWPGGYIGSNLAVPFFFAALHVAAMILPVRRPRTTLLLVTTVQFACFLVCGPLLAMLTIGASGFLVTCALHVLQQRALWNGIFFTTQSMIGLGVAGLVLHGLNAMDVTGASLGWRNVVALSGAAASLYLFNVFARSTALSVQAGKSPIEQWLRELRLDITQTLALYLVGLVAALLVRDHPWAIAVMVLPAIVMHLTLRRSVQHIQETISTAAVEAMADVIDMRDHYTFEHSKRVAAYAECIAREMDFPDTEINAVRLAARVHDLGKVGVPDHVLLKPDKLNDDEWKLMQRHPELGYNILSRFTDYAYGKDLVLLHHERYDGQGYPSGIGGEQLSLGAQVISLADTFDAMTTDRPYRRALPHDVILAELRCGSGVQWRPDVVDALERLMHDEHGPLTTVMKTFEGHHVESLPPQPAAAGAVHDTASA